MFETIYSSPTNYALRRLPSVREQVELCRHIASQLVANDNINSKGATMFFKRVKKAHTWEVPPLDSKEQEMIENTDEDKIRQQLAETLLRNKEHRLSLVLDPRGKIHSLSSLQAEGQKVNEHNAVTPDLMSRLMKDLESPEANPKAAELFAKRKAMAHEWETVTEPWKNQHQAAPGPPPAPHPQEQQRMQQQQMEQNGPLPDLSKINNNISNHVNGSQAAAGTTAAWQPPQPQQQPQVHRRSSAGLGLARPDDAAANKRYSLLDPEIFVPTAGSRLSCSKYGSDRIRAPSPWRAGGSPAPPAYVNAAPPVNSYNTMTNAAPVSVATVPVPEAGRGVVLERKEGKTLIPAAGGSMGAPACNPSFPCPVPTPSSSSCFPPPLAPTASPCIPSRTLPPVAAAAAVAAAPMIPAPVVTNTMMGTSSVPPFSVPSYPLPLTTPSSSSSANYYYQQQQQRTDRFADSPSSNTLTPSNPATAAGSHVASVPLSSLCVSPVSVDGSVMSGAGSSDSNNFSNYTNYFYQTLKHSNPYQNLPESILL